MESNHKSYDFRASFDRLTSILNQSDVNYEETKQLPSRDKLTFTNGFYAYCSALFVDIRDSSDLPSKYKRPSLARLYRAYISEVVAVMNDDPYCREINIVGDGVWCVVNTPRKTDIDDVFATGFRIHSLIDVLNYKLRKRGMDEIYVGIGMDYGRALMIKAGYSGSGINDVVYMGDVVNRAAKLAAQGGKKTGYWSRTPTLMVGEVFGDNLNEHNQDLVTWDYTLKCYTSNAISAAMQDWYDENCP